MQEKLLFLVGQVTRSLSSIIKNYRTLQGESISIGMEQKIISQEKAIAQEKAVAQEIIDEQKIIHIKEIEEEAKKEAQKLLSEAKMQAEVILEEAYNQKEYLLNTWQQEIECLKQETSDQMAKDQEASQEKVKQIIEEAYIEKKKILEEAEPELVEALSSLLYTIVDIKLVSGIEWLTLLVKRMVEKEHLLEVIKVHVATRLYEQYQDEMKNAFEGLSISVEVIPDHHIEETSCLVETAVGSIHYDIRKGLQKVLDEIKILSAI